MARAAGQAARSKRLEREQRHLDVRASDVPADGRWDKKNCATGVWLSVVPSWLNGTSILEDEWRDNIQLRYSHQLLKMPNRCDGCGERMTVEHALACKNGGLVHIWHLCGTALSFGGVEREPRIFSSIGRLAKEAGATVVTPPSGERDKMQLTKEHRDAGAHGFWQ